MHRLALPSLLVALVVSLLVAACGGGSPQSTLDAYAAAVDRGDAEAAYALLSEEYRERVPFERFAERFDKVRRSNGAAIVRALEDASGEAAYVDAVLPYNEFDALKLTLTRSGWRIDEGLFNFYGQRTPRETLYSFVKAVERRKYEVLMRFVPMAYAGSMTPDTIRAQFEQSPATVDEMVELLRQNKDNLIKSQGNRAWMEYGQFRIDFIKENGVWKVEDPD